MKTYPFNQREREMLANAVIKAQHAQELVQAIADTIAAAHGFTGMTLMQDGSGFIWPDEQEKPHGTHLPTTGLNSQLSPGSGTMPGGTDSSGQG